MNICITHVYMKKWQKEQEEWILREQEKRREKIQDSTLQIGSKRYSFPIDLKKPVTGLMMDIITTAYVSMQVSFPLTKVRAYL